MRLTPKQAHIAFIAIRELAERIKPQSVNDSIVVSCCTQFELALELSPEKAIDLCNRIIAHLRVTDSYRAMLLTTIRDMRTILEDSLPS